MFNAEELFRLETAVSAYIDGYEGACPVGELEAQRALLEKLGRLFREEGDKARLAADEAGVWEKPKTVDELEEALSAGKRETSEQRAERERLEARWDRLKGLEAASRVVDPTVWGDAAPVVVMRYADRFAVYLRTGVIPENASEPVGDWS